MTYKEDMPGNLPESEPISEASIKRISDGFHEFERLSPAEREEWIGPHLPEALLHSIAEGTVDLRRQHRHNVHLLWCPDCRQELHGIERQQRESIRALRPCQLSPDSIDAALIHTRFFHADLSRRSGALLLRIECDQASDIANLRIGEKALPASCKKLFDREVLEADLGSEVQPGSEVEISFDYGGGHWARRVHFVA